MEIEHEVLSGDIQLIRPIGKLDVFTFVELKNFLDAQGGLDRSVLVVVDMSRVDHVASSGWSVLLGRRKLMRLSGGDLVVCGLTPEVERVYRAMKVDPVLPSAPDVAGALALLQAVGGHPGGA